MIKKPIIVIKYGGNAMINNSKKKAVLENISKLKEKGYDVLISHGGGPFIKETLDKVNVKSEFIGGQRVTSEEALEYIEMTLKGKVNSDIVNTLNTIGEKAVGLSGKDARIVVAAKRKHKIKVDDNEEFIDIGRVGNVVKVDTDLLKLLLANDYIPVLSCIASDENGLGYNINGDIFAAHIAGELNAGQFILITDVDGIYKDKNDPDSKINSLEITDINKLINDEVIVGGMLPKVEACETAIRLGAESAKIINGTKPQQLMEIENEEIGTLITMKK